MGDHRGGRRPAHPRAALTELSDPDPTLLLPWPITGLSLGTSAKKPSLNPSQTRRRPSQGAASGSNGAVTDFLQPLLALC
jgi:hypothetical protein